MFTGLTDSLPCSFAANYHLNDLNFPRPTPISPCSSVGRATVICSGGRGFQSHQGQRFFLFCSVWAYFLSRDNAQKVLFGILLEHFNLSQLNLNIRLRVLNGQTLLITPSLICLQQFTRPPNTFYTNCCVGRQTVV